MERDKGSRRTRATKGGQRETLKAVRGVKSQVAAGGKPISHECIARAFMPYLCYGLMHLRYKILEYLQYTDLFFSVFPSFRLRSPRWPRNVRTKLKRENRFAPALRALIYNRVNLDVAYSMTTVVPHPPDNSLCYGCIYDS